MTAKAIEKAKNKKRLQELVDKHYKGKRGKTAKKENEKIAKIVKAKKQYEKATAEEVTPKTGTDVAKGNTGHKAGSRADLMDQAKVAGVKYFRILSRQQLTEVFSIMDEPDNQGKNPNEIPTIQAIQQEAQTRWKAGWGNKGGRKAEAEAPKTEAPAEATAP